MSEYLPPVVLRLKANARDAYVELAKFRAAVASTMKGAVADVNAGGKAMEAAAAGIGKDMGEALGEHAGETAAKTTVTKFQKTMRSQYSWLAHALNADVEGNEAGIRMARAAIRGWAGSFATRLRAVTVGPIERVWGAATARMSSLWGRAAKAAIPATAALRNAVLPSVLAFTALGQEAKAAGEKVVAKAREMYQRIAPLRWVVQGYAKAFGLLKRAGTEAFQAVGKAVMGALPFLAMASSSIALIGTLAASVAVKLVAFGKGIASLGPLVAFAPSLVIGLLLLGKTLSSVTAGIRREFKGVGEEIKKTRKDVEEIGSKGFDRVARDFKKANLPAITGAMRDIAREANRVGLRLGDWINSADGVRLIRDTARGVTAAFREAAPKIEKAVEALGRLANRAGLKDRIEGVGAAIGRMADRFAKWADSKSAKDIADGLKTVSDAFGFLRDKIRAVKDVIVWMADNQDKIRKMSDALAAVGIAIGLWTGNPIAVVAGALTLLINHWDEVKAKFSGVGGWWKQTWERVKNDPSIKRIVDAAKDNWRAFREGFDSTLGMIKEQWSGVWADLQETWREVGPTIATMWESAKPAVKAFGVFLGMNLAGMGAAIRGFLAIVRLIDKAFETVASIVGGVLRGMLMAVAGMLDKMATAVGVFDKDLAAKMRNAADAARGGAAEIQGWIDGIQGKTVYVTVKGIVNGRVTSLQRAADSANQREGRGIASNATGTAYFPGGLTWVGEQGPELLNLPRGSQIHRTGASMRMARDLPGYAGMPGQMGALGAAAAAGLASGIAGGQSRVTAAMAAVAKSVPATTAKVLEIRSPSKKMKPLGSAILSGVLRGLEEQSPAVFKWMRAFSNRIASIKVSPRLRTKIQNMVTDALPGFRNRIAGLDDRIEAWKDKAASLRDARASMASSIAGSNYGGAASLIGAADFAPSGNLGSDYALTMERNAARMKRFQAQLNILRKRGLSKNVIQDFAAQGYAQAGDLVNSLTHNNRAVLRTINRNDAAMRARSKAIGKQYAGDMYDAGIRAADGMVRGLQKQRKRLIAEMGHLARALVNAIKKALRIKSPSGVMADEVGAHLPGGVALGVVRNMGAATGAVRTMGRAITGEARKIPLPGAAGGGAAGGGAYGGGAMPGGGGPVEVHVYLDSREVYAAVQTRALRKERRDGTNGLSRAS